MVRVDVVDVVETTSYKKLYNNKDVDHDERGYCAKFQQYMTSGSSENVRIKFGTFI